ncbi:hypothetical protein M3I54_17220 [Paraburkholderia sp. CNPSo 3274]|uniref:hypothetical protein n=1 Tax=Paraburkholderia sp. CNPSo 3274 TaxID=2940932 RepID=UPI0020B88F77|nr:hypothetical protein [Paraburkholderia sp. CNPSo 3274]MCP3708712.1 hypothetical protein [Paraburkholderia sp. CNPSo 3274]
MAWTSDNTTVRRSIHTPAWLLAGIVAITVNTALLDVAARGGLDTGNGVLLRLIRPWIGPLLDRTGWAHAWLTVGLSGPESHEFSLGFHIFIGMLMALTYGYGERLLTSKPWRKGLVFAILVYAANAFVLLPLLGEGIAGSRKLSGMGQGYFAFAHTRFFLILACCHDRLSRRSFATSTACRADARRD